MEWTWDADKARANLRKHGVTFEAAVLVFDDPMLFVSPDPHPDDDRWQVIGRTGPATLFVVTPSSKRAAAGSSAPGALRQTRESGMKTVIHKSKGLTPEIKAQLEALAAMPDDAIDLSDMPEVTDFTGWTRGRFYRPVKQQLTLRLDADVVHWFKAQAEGGGYQTRINQALRDHIEDHRRKRA